MKSTLRFAALGCFLTISICGLSGCASDFPPADGMNSSEKAGEQEINPAKMGLQAPMNESLKSMQEAERRAEQRLSRENQLNQSGKGQMRNQQARDQQSGEKNSANKKQSEENRSDESNR